MTSGLGNCIKQVSSDGHWVAPVIVTLVLAGVTDPSIDLNLNGVFHKLQLYIQLLI